MVKPQLKYPVEWTARIIAEASETSCLDNLKNVLAKFNLICEIKAGTSSQTGKYVTYVFTITLESHDMMVDLFTQISHIKGVKFAL